jgi:7,8-dihydroneopterin aldolase/epimerase/oxygenase
MTAARIFLSGIRASGRHGANPGEQDEPQELVIDLDLEIDVDADDIAATADYRRLATRAHEVVRDRRFDLIESLAGAVAEAIAAEPHVMRATAVVHKPAAARSLGIDGVAAAATAGRD